MCLAPNLLHANTKSEKMNANESRLLQMETNIVQILIESAEKIGGFERGFVDVFQHNIQNMYWCFVIILL